MRQEVVLDRALEPAWLDLALRQAGVPLPTDERRKALEMSLRDRIEALEGRRKTVRVLSRIWLTPPESSAAMIAWAIEHAPLVRDSRVLHLGALLASQPFFGNACAIVGRELSLHQEVQTGDVRRKLRERWGDREIIDVSGRAVVRTLRAFGALKGVKGDDRSEPGDRLAVDEILRPWLIHAFLLTRGILETSDDQLRQAPEFFVFESFPATARDYPFLDLYTEGGGRRVYRQRGIDESDKAGQGHLFV